MKIAFIVHLCTEKSKICCGLYVKVVKTCPYPSIHPSIVLFPPRTFSIIVVCVEHRDFRETHYVCVHVCVGTCVSFRLHYLEDTWELGRRVCPGKKNRNKKKKGRGRISIMISRLFFDIVAGLSRELCVCVCVDPAIRHMDPLSEISLSTKPQNHYTRMKPRSLSSAHCQHEFQ